jgi:hypothetical protein
MHVVWVRGESGIDLTELFEQYLRTTMVPTLEYRIRGSTLSFRWTNVVQRFDMPVRVRLAPGGYAWIQPTEAWQDAELRVPAEDFGVDPDFYVIATPIG